jgi:predicted Zn-dependent protease
MACSKARIGSLIAHLLYRFYRAGICALTCVLAGCASGRVPITPGTVPQGVYLSAEDEAYGHQVLSTLTETYPLSRNDADIQRVRGLVQRLAQAGGVDGSPWHVFVLQDDTVVNAAATRGNYVFVWTGMLRMAQSNGELATVLAHELGHLLANHTQPTATEEANEIMARASGEIAGQLVAIDPYYGPLAQLAAIAVTETIKAIAVNPESQRLETEADHIGFFLMADAGFDPEEALNFWAKMSQSTQSGHPALSFLSSHPDSEERLFALRALLPQALSRYKLSTRPRIGTSTSPTLTAVEDSFALP